MDVKKLRAIFEETEESSRRRKENISDENEYHFRFCEEIGLDICGPFLRQIRHILSKEIPRVDICDFCQMAFKLGILTGRILEKPQEAKYGKKNYEPKRRS